MPQKEEIKSGDRTIRKKISDLSILLDVTRLLSSDTSLSNILQTMFQTTTQI